MIPRKLKSYPLLQKTIAWYQEWLFKELEKARVPKSELKKVLVESQIADKNQDKLVTTNATIELKNKKYTSKSSSVYTGFCEKGSETERLSFV